MSEFDSLRRLLEERGTEFGALADDPAAFARELDGLRRFWHQETDPELRLEETRDVLARHPRVREAVEAELNGHAAAPPPPPPLPPPVAMVGRARSADAVIAPPNEPPADTPTHHPVTRTTMPADLPASEISTQLAIWDKRLAIAKEIITGLLGLAIVLTMLVMLVVSFTKPLEDAQWSRVKDLLLYMNGIAGVVLGYYFGRVPTEIRAQTAERAADEAQRDAGGARAQLEDTRREVEGVLEEATAVGAATARGGGAGGGAGQLSTSQVERLRAIARRR
jgi:hypothetical protein